MHSDWLIHINHFNLQEAVDITLLMAKMAGIGMYNTI